MITNINHHNPLQRRCIDCPTTPPVCGCPSDQQCILVGKSCDACAFYKCIPKDDGKSSKSVGGGAVAGAVIGSLILLAAVVVLFLWRRKRARAAALAASSSSGPKDVPAHASDVLNRPDPNEKAQQEAAIEAVQQQQETYSLYPAHQTHMNLDPEAQQYTGQPASAIRPHAARRITAGSNPFSDTHSIQTTSTGSQSVNVIPIALVPRTPMGDANMDHMAVSDGTPSYVPSEPSNGSPVPPPANVRNSYMSGLTTVTDIINEAPRFVTPVRQVLNVGKAEVLVRTPGSSAPSTPASASDSLRASPANTARALRSPLAASTFGPGDVLHEDAAGEANPFGDENARGRPVSGLTLATNAGTIIADIAEATRVQVLPAHAGTPSLHRVASGRLVTPRSRNVSAASSTATSPAGAAGTLQEQQARALAYAQLRAREQGGPQTGSTPNASRRVSDASVSTRADSILESFPFVPPSPISDRPLRSPRSPLGQDTLRPPTSPLAGAPITKRVEEEEGALENPRKLAGFSTGSQFSTASSGLGAFAFAMDAPAATSNGGLSVHAGLSTPNTGGIPTSAVPPTSTIPGVAPSAFARQQQQALSAGKTGAANVPQRASLDTLALTADLASYPLGFEQPPVPSPALPRRE